VKGLGERLLVKLGFAPRLALISSAMGYGVLILRQHTID
jgi:hypothetical protein